MNFKEANIHVLKGGLFVAGIAIAAGSLYTVSKMYQSGKQAYSQFQQTQTFEEYVKTDSRFANGIMLTKFCIDVYNTKQMQTTNTP